jgi:hypothetical protein
LVVTPVGLLVLGWLAPHAFRPGPAAYFLFDCATVSDMLIRPSVDEVREHAFVALHTAAQLTTAATMRRLTATATARATGRTIICLADPRTV